MVSRFIGKIKVYTGALKFKLYSAFGIMLLLIAMSTATAVLLAVKQVIIVQVGQSRIDVLKQISERSNIIKNNLITVINLYKYNTDLDLCTVRNYNSRPKQMIDDVLQSFQKKRAKF